MKVGAPASRLMETDVEAGCDLKDAKVGPGGRFAELDELLVLDPEVHGVLVSQRTDETGRDARESRFADESPGVDGLVVVEGVNACEHLRWWLAELAVHRSAGEVDGSGVSFGVELGREHRILGLDGEAGQRGDREVLHPDRVGGVHGVLPCDGCPDVRLRGRFGGSVPDARGESLIVGGELPREVPGPGIPSQLRFLVLASGIKGSSGGLEGADEPSDGVDVPVVGAELRVIADDLLSQLREGAAREVDGEEVRVKPPNAPASVERVRLEVGDEGEGHDGEFEGDDRRRGPSEKVPRSPLDAACVLASLGLMTEPDGALPSPVVDRAGAHRGLIKAAVSNEMVVAHEGPRVSLLRSAGWRDGLLAPVVRVQTVKGPSGQIALESTETTELASAVEAAKWASELVVLAAVAGTLWLILTGPSAGLLADLLGVVVLVGVGAGYVLRFFGRRRRRNAERERMAAVVDAVLDRYSVNGAGGYRRELPVATSSVV